MAKQQSAETTEAVELSLHSDDQLKITQLLSGSTHAILLTHTSASLLDAAMRSAQLHCELQTPPVQTMKIDTSGSSITLEQVHAIRQLTKLSHSTETVLLISQFEKATTEAQNALLKQLEEPPAHLRFVITSSNAAKILPTIRSRCQMVQLQNPTIAQLSQAYERDEADISKALRASNGDIDMLSSNKTMQFAKQFIQGNLYERLLLASDKPLSERATALAMLKNCIAIYRSLIGASASQADNPAHKKRLVKSNASLEHCLAAYEHVASNGHIKTVLSDLACKL